MGYRTLKEAVLDLEKHGRLVRIDEEVDPCLEVAEIHRRVFQNGGPAVFYTNVKGCRFPLVSNLFGTTERARFIFRDTWEAVSQAIQLKIDPSVGLKNPWRYRSALRTAWNMLPKFVGSPPVAANSIRLSDLPQVKSWPKDGGAFVTLPQVYSEDVRDLGWRKSNLGMYRVQLSGNEYKPESEIGLHYQIHRGIGVHHRAAIQANAAFHVNLFVGGTPAMTLAAVMPLPEGMSELSFAGALAGHRIPLAKNPNGISFYANADFVVTGQVDLKKTKPEGPFGDHLGYYSLVHPFPVLNVANVMHRNDAIWPFTVVGRPPQEDTSFGEVIHELTGPIIPTVLPGIREVHAVDAAGVHPLLLAIGAERYTPYAEQDAPAELLTQANAVLGQGQMSLAKYLWIANRFDDEQLTTHDLAKFFQHILARAEWSRDVHFQTKTTIDTLDYSGSGFNTGSKVVIAAAGRAKYSLGSQVPSGLTLPDGFSQPKICFPGVLAIQGPSAINDSNYRQSLRRFCDLCRIPADSGIRLMVVVDDSDMVARNVENFVWVTFTRSNPAVDIDGLDSFVEDKHWGCRGPLVIDARLKPHLAPVLEESPEITKRVDALAAKSLPISKYL